MMTPMSLVIALTCSMSVCHAGLLSSLSSGSMRVRRQAYGQPNMGYGGGISMTVALDPYNRNNPVNFADSVQFGYGINGAGVNQAKTIGYSNTIGNGQAGGNSFGGAGDGYGFGGGNANTLVAGSPGYGQAQTNNFGWSGSSGNGFGRGSASGQVIPFGRRR